MTTTTTTTAGNHQTVTLDEGQALNVLPDSAGSGTAYLLDNSLGLGNSSQSWALSAGIPLQLGPFSGTRRVRIVCATGTIQATALPAVLNLPQTVVSASAPSNSDGRPDGTIYIQSGAGIFVKVSGSYVATGSAGSSPATKTQNLGNVSGALVIDLSLGWNIFMTVTGNITSMTFTNGPSNGNKARVEFQITNGGAFSITWPAGIRWNGPGVVGSAPTLQASGVENVVNTISNPAGSTLIGGYYLGREV